MCIQSPDHGSVSCDSAFIDGSGMQYRDYAEEIQATLPQSQAADIGHYLSILPGFDCSYPRLTLPRALLASSNSARERSEDEACFVLSKAGLSFLIDCLQT